MKLQMNRRMRQLLQRMNFSEPLGAETGSTDKPGLVLANQFILLEAEFRRAKVAPEDFPDRTGYESFINHMHLPYDGTRECFKSCLSYVNALRNSLTEFGKGREFLMILSVSDDDCVVRFHERRANERWVSSDLEEYREEAVLVIPVASAIGH